MILKFEVRRPRSGRLPFFGFWVWREIRDHRRERLWESGKPGFGFPLFHGREAGLWECGNLALLARFPRDGGKSGKAALAFPRFPPSRHFHSPFPSPVARRIWATSGIVTMCTRMPYLLGGVGDSLLHRRKSCALAADIFRADSVSLIFRAICSNWAKLV